LEVPGLALENTLAVRSANVTDADRRDVAFAAPLFGGGEPHAILSN
jgi:hypothetical protein